MFYLKKKENRTLLGIHFLQTARIILHAKNRQWYFHDIPNEVFDLISVDDPSLLQKLPNMFNSCVILKEEGNNQPENLKEELSKLIRESEDVFKPV